MKFYQYHTGMIVCDKCLQRDLEDTRQGKLKGEEGVRPGMYHRVPDDQTEAYQCDSCLEQNDAYDELEYRE